MFIDSFCRVCIYIVHVHVERCFQMELWVSIIMIKIILNRETDNGASANALHDCARAVCQKCAANATGSSQCIASSKQCVATGTMCQKCTTTVSFKFIIEAVCYKCTTAFSFKNRFECGVPRANSPEMSLNIQNWHSVPHLRKPRFRFSFTRILE
jgi:hypothetical protein